jgi:hypothetical protein
MANNCPPSAAVMAAANSAADIQTTSKFFSYDFQL